MPRSEPAIMQDINNAYTWLSPENLTHDGELSPARVLKARRSIEADLERLFKELGRRVTEDEALDYCADRYVEQNDLPAFLKSKC